jgi:hypothetical protein
LRIPRGVRPPSAIRSSEALDVKLKDIEDSSEEKFESLKRGVAEAVDEPANDIGKEAEKPR